MVERESDPLADKIVGVSPRIEELALRHLDAQKVTHILNGIKLPKEIPGQYKKCSDRPKDILFVGRIDNRQKAVFLIPDIIQYLLERDIRTSVTMVGDGPDFEELRQRIEERSLSEFIHLTGQLEPEEVSAYYFTHKILLLPSNFEGHPLTLMEAMAHACVPVASLLPQCTDTCVDQGKSGYLVEVGKVNDFGHGIWELLSSKKLLNKMSENALSIARERFSSVHTHQSYLKLLGSFEGREFDRKRFPLLNRKYMSWKEMVPFQLVLFIKRKLVEAR